MCYFCVIFLFACIIMYIIMYALAKLSNFVDINDKFQIFFQKNGKKFGKSKYIDYLCSNKFITEYG